MLQPHQAVPEKPEQENSSDVAQTRPPVHGEISVAAESETAALYEPQYETRCFHCNNDYADAKRHCPNCGYPMNGSVEDRDKFNYAIGYKKLQLDEADKKVRNAKIYMYVLAGLMSLATVIQYTNGDTASAIAYLILGTIYVGLGQWTATKPFAAILTGLILFLTVQLLGIVLDPTSIFSGIIIKVLVVVALITGSRSAYEAERIRREYNL